MSEVGKAEEAMKQAIFEKFYQELPYQVGIKVAAWVPKINGELRVDYQIDVKSRVQQGVLLGEKARIIREVRERCQQLLAQRLQRPVVCVIEITQRRNKIEVQNQYDTETKAIHHDANKRRRN